MSWDAAKCHQLHVLWRLFSLNSKACGHSSWIFSSSGNFKSSLNVQVGFFLAQPALADTAGVYLWCWVPAAASSGLFPFPVPVQVSGITLTPRVSHSWHVDRDPALGSCKAPLRVSGLC